jgi:hypothetical protein
LVVELAVAMVQGEESSWRMERAALPLNQALAYGVQAHAAAAAAAAAPPTCFLYCLSLFPRLTSGLSSIYPSGSAS